MTQLVEILIGAKTAGYYGQETEQGVIVAVFIDDHGELQIVVQNPAGGLYQTTIGGVTIQKRRDQ